MDKRHVSICHVLTSKIITEPKASLNLVDCMNYVPVARSLWSLKFPPTKKTQTQKLIQITLCTLTAIKLN